LSTGGEEAADVHHSGPAEFLTAAGVGLVLIVVLLVIAVLVRSRMNAGPLQERWHEIRRGLTFGQRRELYWANMRHRLVRQPGLGTAQLAYTRYAADAFRRAPMTRHRGIRIGLPVLYLVVAASQLAPALTSPRSHPLSLIAAGFSLTSVVLLTYTAIRGLGRAERKISNLQHQLEIRYGETAN
jgi:hypothetical protein